MLIIASKIAWRELRRVHPAGSGGHPRKRPDVVNFDQIITAAKRSGEDEFIVRLTEQYDTKLKKKGFMLNSITSMLVHTKT
ncbi:MULTISPECIES: hypothetical protein [Paenibacillus]|uniref:hypothetical protein n=1 Tax=Paenibacillus TaxID=44249 RepID=UPI00046D655C|nr:MULTISPECIES: hypothetical protein [Paenibacillus]NJJ39208.1 hypothetical protein [Paenibacillus apii]